VEAFLDKVYAPLEDTQVKALFWCLGTHGATWKSEAVELMGDVHGRRYESARTYTYSENVRQMLERGEDPPAAVIQRGHELGLHVYASVRMNDNHFEGAQIQDLEKAHQTELTRFRIEHPEWLLGDQNSEWFALSWNFAVPEVRQHRFDHVEELCQLYDWDGVELDWQRHAFHLPRDQAYRLRYVLTDLQRAIRQMTNRLAKQRGRPFYVSVRVAPTLEMCRRIGYDVPVWIKENLMDILVPAGGYGMDSSIEVKSYLDLCRDTGIKVYPGLDVALDTLTQGVHSGHEPFVGPENRELKDKMRNRAVANGYYRAGTDGIYVFNWHADRKARRELLTQIGSPATLRRTDKLYAATYRSLITEGPWRGALRNDRILGPVPVALKPTLTGDGPTIVLEIADDLSTDPPSKVELRLRLDQWVKGDVVRILWDGVPRTNVKTQYHHDPEANAWDRVSDVSSAAWLSSSFAASEHPSVGRHEVQVVLERRNPKLASDIVLTNVELVITYG
jgi:hypothetical protein